VLTLTIFIGLRHRLICASQPITRGIVSKVETSFLNGQFKTHFSYLESQLKSSPGNGQYLCGKDITGADILLSFPLISAKSKVDKSTYPALAAYIELLDSNEVYRKSIKKVEEVSRRP
jgi:glutathione S-transferase